MGNLHQAQYSQASMFDHIVEDFLDTRVVAVTHAIEIVASPNPHFALVDRAEEVGMFGGVDQDTKSVVA